MFRFRRKKRAADPVAVVQRFVDAANRHDAGAIAECLHPDFDSVQPIYPSRNFRGADQVRRNWQAIFQSEPGFRLTLLRSAASDGTVWVELHGAGKEVEVAGVFIMGVENNLVRWARVYSAVVDQEFQGPVDTGDGEAPAMALDDDGVHDARVAAELREMLEAGRQTAGTGAITAEPEPEPEQEPQPVPAAVGDDDTVLWAQPADDHDDTAAPLPLLDELATGEQPVVEPEPEPVAEELEPVVGTPEAPEPAVAADDPAAAGQPAVAPDEPAAPQTDRERTAAALADLFESSPSAADEAESAPEPEPVIELVTPEAEAPAADDGPGEPAPDDDGEREGAVLELKPDRRFRRLPKPSRRS